MSYSCRRLGSQSVSRLCSLHSNTGCEKKQKKKPNLHLLVHTGAALPWQRRRWGRLGEAQGWGVNLHLLVPNLRSKLQPPQHPLRYLLWIDIRINKGCIFVKCTCDFSDSFPMVASHQGQHAGCSADSGPPVPKKPWRWCGVSGASLGAITFQRENKLTTFVPCTSLIVAGRKEKSRCERSCALYTKGQMDANSRVHANVSHRDMRNGMQAWKPPQWLSCDSPNRRHSIRWPLMLCRLCWVKGHCCCHW